LRLRSGLVGSLYYTSNLTPEDADKIRFYFNYDMIGSPAPSYIVYDGEPIGSNKLLAYLTAKGLPAKFG
jgi:Zn-dependent M28 family amino/carboxypeptidase